MELPPCGSNRPPTPIPGAIFHKDKITTHRYQNKIVAKMQSCSDLVPITKNTNTIQSKDLVKVITKLKKSESSRYLPKLSPSLKSFLKSSKRQQTTELPMSDRVDAPKSMSPTSCDSATLLPSLSMTSTLRDISSCRSQTTVIDNRKFANLPFFARTTDQLDAQTRNIIHEFGLRSGPDVAHPEAIISESQGLVCAKDRESAPKSYYSQVEDGSEEGHRIYMLAQIDKFLTKFKSKKYSNPKIKSGNRLVSSREQLVNDAKKVCSSWSTSASGTFSKPVAGTGTTRNHSRVKLHTTSLDNAWKQKNQKLRTCKSLRRCISNENIAPIPLTNETNPSMATPERNAGSVSVKPITINKRKNTKVLRKQDSCPLLVTFAKPTIKLSPSYQILRATHTEMHGHRDFHNNLENDTKRRTLPSKKFFLSKTLQDTKQPAQKEHSTYSSIGSFKFNQCSLKTPKPSEGHKRRPAILKPPQFDNKSSQLIGVIDVLLKLFFLHLYQTKMAEKRPTNQLWELYLRELVLSREKSQFDKPFQEVYEQLLLEKEHNRLTNEEREEYEMKFGVLRSSSHRILETLYQNARGLRFGHSPVAVKEVVEFSTSVGEMEVKK